MDSNGTQARIHIHSSWIIAGVLVSWSMARQAFPLYFPTLSIGTFWFWGVVSVVAVFLSVLFHESAHAIMARALGVSPRQVHLYIFGDVPGNERVLKPDVDAVVAAAGPVASLLLAGAFLLAAFLCAQFRSLTLIRFVFDRLAAANFLIAAVNLFPAQPLDGGRIFRSALRSWRDNFALANRVSRATGLIVVVFAFIIGNLSLLNGMFMTGIWLIFLGVLLDQGLRESNRPLHIYRYLRGHRTGDYMRLHPVSVAPTLTIETFVYDYLQRFQFEIFPVLAHGKPVRVITVNDIRALARDQWEHVTVGDVARVPEETVTTDTDITETLASMKRQGIARSVVIDKAGKLAGVVTFHDLLPYFASKIDLSEPPRSAKTVRKRTPGARPRPGKRPITKVLSAVLFGSSRAGR